MKTTGFTDIHIQLGAKMSPFAGYQLKASTQKTKLTMTIFSNFKVSTTTYREKFSQPLYQSKDS